MSEHRICTDSVVETFRCAPGVRCVVERRGILLVTQERGAVCSIPYPAAAVWDLMSRGYRHHKIVEMIGHIASLDAAAAHRFVSAALRQWGDSGFLIEDKHG